METILNKITNILGKAFCECGYDFSYGKTTVSGRPDLCQFQCNGAMVGAKAYKKSPMQIANEVIEKMDKTLFDVLSLSLKGFDNISIELDINNSLNILAMIENYASICYNVTQKHINEIKKLSSIEECLNYDITADYPTILNITLND